MKFTKAIAATGIAVGASLTVLPPAHAVDLSTATTDASLCSQIGRGAFTGDTANYFAFEQVDIPGAGTKTNFVCGPELPLNKPPVPTDGTSVTVNTGLGAFAFPCRTAPVTPGSYNAATQYDYLGTWNSTFQPAPQNSWADRSAYWGARKNAQYQTYTVFIADKPGTFPFTGSFTDSTGAKVQCNLTVNVSTKAANQPTSTTTEPSAKCTAAKKSLAAAKAKGTKKQVTAAKKKVTTACKG